MRDDAGTERTPTPERTTRVVVRAAFRHFPGCCPEPIEVGEPMRRTTHNRYIHPTPECRRSLR